MGKKVGRRILRLVFEDNELEGLVVRVKAMTVGQYLQMTEMEGDPSVSLQEYYGQLVSAIVDWNLEGEDDQPVPVTYEGLCTLEGAQVSRIIKNWVRGSLRIDESLGKDSTSGEPSPVASLPMEAPSGNPSN